MFAYRESLGEILSELEWFTGIGLDGDASSLRVSVLKMLGDILSPEENARVVWSEAESMVESLWVGGMLYAPEIADRMSNVLALASAVARALDVYPAVEPVFGLDYSSYFLSKYHEYWRVYEKAGDSDAFAPMGQNRLNELAIQIHEREGFFDSLLSDYDSNNLDSLTLDELGAVFLDFPGVDRRVEIIRRLTHESDMVYGGFSTFDPRRTIDFLIDEIRHDYYGGCYVPLGEDEKSYECIVPQLRLKWLQEHSIS